MAEASRSTKVLKPADSTWTDDKWLTITHRGEDILVAAAAGSGKTAVLVKRINHRVSDEAEPMDVIGSHLYGSDCGENEPADLGNPGT